MNKILELSSHARALVVVAHPDDEVIWMGGTIMRFSDVEWTVLSLCRKSDRDREPKFNQVSKELGFKGIIDDVEDEDLMNVKDSIAIFERAIKNNIKNKSFDYCFTHNKNGEYGHDRHIGVHFAMKRLFDIKEIKIKKLFFFDYIRKDRKILPMIPCVHCSHFLELSKAEYDRKRQIVAEMYGYPYEGIDVNLCTKIEAFKKY